MITLLRRWFVWLSRIHHSRGFGIQSPTDYAFVRYVINEHWPYYAYDELPDADWLTQKLGRLYLRLANWRQPTYMLADEYQEWWHAGCKKTQFLSHPSPLTTHHSPLTSCLSPQKVELARVGINDDFEALLQRCDTQSVLVVEGLWQNWKCWHDLTHDSRVGTTFDLYYCGIAFFDKNRYNHHYIINF